MNTKSPILYIIKIAIISMLFGAIAEICVSKWEQWRCGRVLEGDLAKSVAHDDGFEKSPDGNLISVREGAMLQIALGDASYLAQLAIRLKDNVNVPIELSYRDSRSREIVKQKPAWQVRLRYTPYRFMDTAIFAVNARVQHLELVTQGPGISITGISAIRGSTYNSKRMLVASGTVFLLILLACAVTTGKVSPALVTLCTATCTGLCFALLSPLTFTSWDESIHYRNSDRLSLHAVAPQPVRDVFSRAHVLPHSYSTQEQEQINRFFNSQPAGPTAPKKEAKKASVFETVFGWYRSAGYLPSAFGLFAGRLLGLDNHNVFKLGRISNLVIYALILATAVAVTPMGKLTMAAIGLLPTSIFLASHYSYDPWLTCLTMLGVALFLRAANSPDGSLGTTGKILLIAVPLLAVGPKPIYCLTILLPLLLPAEKIGTRADVTRFRLLTILAFLYALGSFLLPFLVEGPGPGDSRGGAGVNSTEQVRYMLGNTWEYTVTLTRFMARYLNPVHMQGLAIDLYSLGNIAGYSILCLLFLASFLKDSLDTSRLGIRQAGLWKARLLVIACTLATTALIATALYIAFTPVGHHRINGVQTRYLTPVLMFPALALMPLVTGKQVSARLDRVALGIPIAIGLVTMHGIWTHLASKYY